MNWPLGMKWYHYLDSTGIPTTIMQILSNSFYSEAMEVSRIEKLPCLWFVISVLSSEHLLNKPFPPCRPPNSLGVNTTPTSNSRAWESYFSSSVPCLAQNDVHKSNETFLSTLTLASIQKQFRLHYTKVTI